jgi:putative peptidoglycan lipid II flippase
VTQDSTINQDPPRDFVSATLLISGLTFLSRIAGLVRDALCARLFGAGPIWSSFALAFLLPNLFRRLFGEGALSAALIPEYTKILQQDPLQARRLATATTLSIALILTIACVVGELILLVLLTQTPMGTNGTLTLQLAILLLPYALLICLTAALGGMLQCHHIFAPTASSPIILNGFIILAVVISIPILGLDPESAIFIVSGSVLLAGLIQTIWSYMALRRVGGWTWNTAGTRRNLKRIAMQMMPVVIGLGTLQINTLFDGLLAGWPVLVGPDISLPFLGTHPYPLDADANSILFFAQRLYQFPLGVFGIALATAVFPALARHARNPELFSHTLRKGVRLALFIGIPSTAGIIAVRTDLVSLLFEGGAFQSSDTARVSQVLLAYAPAIWAATATHTLTRAFYAMGQTKTPMRIALVSVACNTILNIALLVPFRESGLAWATSASATIQVILLWIFLRRARGSFLKPPDLRAIGHTLLGTLIMTAILLATGLGFQTEPGDSWLTISLRLFGSITLGAGVYLLLARLRRAEELRWLMSSLRRGSSSESS